MAGKLVYAMMISEKIHFNDYFKDPRFQVKKPQLDPDWTKKCGDNMYFLDENGIWKQQTVIHHNTPRDREKDTKYPYVYVGNLFYYFGKQAIGIPSQFQTLVWQRRGCKCTHPKPLVAQFLAWLHENYSPGVHGMPKDNSISEGCLKKRVPC
jgi:hypothetical protein